MRAKQVLVRGHTLLFEGDAFGSKGGPALGRPTGAGSGKCSCGALSGELANRAARKRWHREHKLEVVAQMEGRDETPESGADSAG